MLGWVLAYALLYWAIHFICNEELLFASQMVKMRIEESEGAANEGSEGFAWAMYGLTKD